MASLMFGIGGKYSSDLIIDFVFCCVLYLCSSFLFLFLFFNLFMIGTQWERERGRDTVRGRSRLHAPGAWRGIRSRVFRIAPWAKGRYQTPVPPRDPLIDVLNRRANELLQDATWIRHHLPFWVNKLLPIYSIWFSPGRWKTQNCSGRKPSIYICQFSLWIKPMLVPYLLISSARWSLHLSEICQVPFTWEILTFYSLLLQVFKVYMPPTYYSDSEVLC